MSIFRKRTKKITATAVLLIGGYFLIIAYMVTKNEPVFLHDAIHEMSPKALDDLGFEQVYQSSPLFFTMRNNSKLAAEHFAHHSNLTILVLHGILSSSYTNNRFSGLIREAANAEVYSLDLRGHGRSDGKPGDVDYIGQYADDVADVVRAIKQEKPNSKILIAGHSMGGGISLRYAMNENSPSVDGYLMFAPQLGENSPTNKVSEPLSNESENNFMAIHLSRLIGLALLNSMGLSQWNDLPVFFFNLPESTPVKSYSFRSSASMSPKDYVTGLQAIVKPLLVIVGENDEAFNAKEYKDVIATNSHGEFLMVAGQTHNGIRHDTTAMKRVENWVATHFGHMSEGE